MLKINIQEGAAHAAFLYILLMIPGLDEMRINLNFRSRFLTFQPSFPPPRSQFPGVFFFNLGGDKIAYSPARDIFSIFRNGPVTPSIIIKTVSTPGCNTKGYAVAG